MNKKNIKQQDEPIEMPERIYIPHGPAQLMEISPELQNNEGAWYVLEKPDRYGDLRRRLLALRTPCQGELPSMYNKAVGDAIAIVDESLTLDQVEQEK